MEPFCPERSGGTDANRAWQVRKTAVRPSFFKKFFNNWLGAESPQLFSVALGFYFWRTLFLLRFYYGAIRRVSDWEIVPKDGCGVHSLIKFLLYTGHSSRLSQRKPGALMRRRLLTFKEACGIVETWKSC
jgi:hypothetical protein